MSILMAHITSFEMTSFLTVFALGCLLGGAATLRFLRSRERSDRN
jgi:hypothetical protein